MMQLYERQAIKEEDSTNKQMEASCERMKKIGHGNFEIS